MGHPAPLFFLLTLSFISEMRNVQFSQQLSAILALSIFSSDRPTLTENGGMDGGTKSQSFRESFRKKNRGV